MSEYWIHQDGDVDFADGDIGDRNHEGIVIDIVQRDIIRSCERVFDLEEKTDRYQRGFTDDEYVDWDKFTARLAEVYLEEHPDAHEDEALELAFKQAGVNQEELMVAEGRTDARTFAMKNWGWKTYRSEHIDTWTLGRNDVKAIISGIESIADESGWDEETLNDMEFVIDVFSNRKYMSMTFKELEEWYAKPGAAPQANMNKNFDYLNHAAKQQIRNVELDNMHPAYKRQGVNPFGDSVTYPSFLKWLEGKKGKLS